MSYKEVKQKYPFAEIKIVSNEEVEKYLQEGFTKASDFIIDNWGTDLSYCYMVY